MPILAPTGLVASEITETSFRLTWVAPAGASGHNVWLDDAYKASVDGPVTYVYTGLTAGTSYLAEVEGYGGGEFSPRAGLTVVTATAEVPPPDSVGATVLRWNGSTWERRKLLTRTGSTWAWV